MEEKRVNLFVYGTLRKHLRYHHYLRDADLLYSQCWTYGKLYDTGRGYPAMVMAQKNRVYGELYSVTLEQLKRVDQLEGYEEGRADNLYQRIIQTVYTDQGEIEAYLYVYLEAVDEERFIQSGDWKWHLYQNRSEYEYLAYGSCMDDERFRIANVDHLFQEVVGRGVLEGFSLRYTLSHPDGGRADIVENGGYTEGKVYRINRDALDYLWKREGVEIDFYRPTFVDVEVNGKLHRDVLTFVVVNKSEEMAPPERYAMEILRGAKNMVSEQYWQQLKNYLVEKFGMKI